MPLSKVGESEVAVGVMSLSEHSIVLHAKHLSHGEARGIISSALRTTRISTVIIDMSQVEETTTSALASLVLLRRLLRRQGRDLRLRGLRDRAEILYHLARLDAVLPCEPRLAV